MAQPKAAPISYRPGKLRAARIEEFGAANGLMGADVLHRLIDSGLQAEGQGSTPFQKIKSGLEDAIAGRISRTTVRPRWDLSAAGVQVGPSPVAPRPKAALKAKK